MVFFICSITLLLSRMKVERLMISRASFIGAMTSIDKFALNFTTVLTQVSNDDCAFAMTLSNDADQRFVAGGAVEGEGDLMVAFDCDGVGKFDDDLGDGEVWEGEDGFDDEWVEVMVAVFELCLYG